jgi:hypothetical protein
MDAAMSIKSSETGRETAMSRLQRLKRDLASVPGFFDV